jgi:MinD-like ATPase involved in chromosome partitioning or flagellar assembly
MALANIAELYYQSGMNVLLIDWDLESPGLERFFGYSPEMLISQSGLMDLYNTYLSQSLVLPDISSYLIDVYQKEQHHLWLLHAGKRFGEYEQEYILNVREKRWKSIVTKNFISSLKKQLVQYADIILIDSRTGYCDIDNICTYQMPDVFVGFCSCTIQSIDGLSNTLSRLQQNDGVDKRKKSIPVIIIPSRFEPESPKIRSFEERFINVFQSCHSTIYRSKEPLLWQIGIPYQKKFSFEELVLVKDGRHSENALLYQAYQNIKKLMDNEFFQYDAFVYYDDRDKEKTDRLIHDIEPKGIKISSLKSIRQKGEIASEIFEKQLSLSRYIIIIWSQHLRDQRLSDVKATVFDQMVWNYIVNKSETGRLIIAAIDDSKLLDILISEKVFDFSMDKQWNEEIDCLLQQINNFS